MSIETRAGFSAADVSAPVPGGLVVVGVNGSPASWDALEWAAAEAAARGADLSVVFVSGRRWIPTPYLLLGGEVGVAELLAAEDLVARAAVRAREVAPEVRVSSSVLPGRRASALLGAAPAGSLIVLGRSEQGWADGRSLAAQVLRRAHGQVSIVGLSDGAGTGPSAHRAVVEYDGTPDSDRSLATAFAVARGRGTGLTALRVPTTAEHPAQVALAGDPLRRWRDAFPDVDVRDRLVTGQNTPALLAETRAAAVVVLPALRRRLLRHRVRTGTRELIGTPAISMIFVRP